MESCRDLDNSGSGVVASEWSSGAIGGGTFNENCGAASQSAIQFREVNIDTRVHNGIPWGNGAGAGSPDEMAMSGTALV